MTIMADSQETSMHYQGSHLIPSLKFCLPQFTGINGKPKLLRSPPKTETAAGF